ncbi:SDR family oxidoreductase [Cerasicoccus arenae]|uniref:dTDP-4-dehydrorhamnose reductase n=1 Tax=Cerasicoccus arenae TaxID=424488 RepID=A0A8J3GFN2_9BACT|nr:SDR family oxidoreductase [Cerasicoccus arenae]MBK1859924.1 SDR family oxidoreductase [Cerasicoccus arenae]GHC12990.1 NAD(P)-dependent oxidoreductase [Cerasicoccus arenae]
MKIIVTGASGLVGNAFLKEAARRRHELIAVSGTREATLPPGARSRQIDLSETAAIEALILEEFPDIIVNCAAISSPAAVEADPTKAEKINVALPRHLAMLANHLSARFYHLSTDMVFDGSQGPYRSTDAPNPRNLYGQTKMLAEREVLKFGKTFATVLRIAIITGNSPGGERSLHEKLFKQWAEGKRTPLYTNELRQPLGVDNLAEVLAELCERPSLHGLFHWAGQDRLSRYEIGQRILKHFDLPEDLIEPIEASDDRPLDLTLDLHPLISKLRTPPLSFADQLAAMDPPVLCRAWHAAMTGQATDAPPPRERFVKGRDF